MGCPIRISTDQSLLAAPHGFSQRATSFIASWCQGIHRMPLSCSISSAILANRQIHHARKPSTALRCHESLLHSSSTDSAHNRFSSVPPTLRADKTNKTLLTPLNPRSPIVGIHPKDECPVRHTIGPRDLRTSICLGGHRTRPETHQNLIYPDKEQQHRRPGICVHGRSQRHGRAVPENHTTNTELLASL